MTKRNMHMKLMIATDMYCECGYPIECSYEAFGDNPGDTLRFYDNHDLQKQVSICPSCNELITLDRLHRSEEQREQEAKALAVGYRILLEAAVRRRERQAREKQESES